MFCGKCGKDIGDLTVCPYCDPRSPVTNDSQFYAQPATGGMNAPQPAADTPAQPVQQPYPEAYQAPVQQPAYPGAGYQQPQYLQQAPQPQKKKSHKGLVIAIVVIVVLLLAGGGVTAFFLTAPMRDYDKAMELKNSGRYQEAITAFTQLNDYKDSSSQITECRYLEAKQLFDSKEFAKAKEAFAALGEYRDSKELITQCDYENAVQLFNDKKYKEAKDAFEQLDGYSDSEQRIIACKYNIAKEEINSNPEDAISIFKEIGDYEDSKDLMQDAMFSYCKANKDENSDQVYEYMKKLVAADYKGADALYKEIYDYQLTKVFWNTDVKDDNALNGMKEIPESKPQVLHFTVTGGTPDDDTRIKYTVTWPNGKTVDNQFDEHGTNFTLTLTNTPKGKLTVDLYTDKDEKLGTATVTVV